jgi:hypothetical protein
MIAPRIFVGRFDPKFLGVGIRARHPSDVQSFRLTDLSQKPPVAILANLSDEVVISDLSRQTVLDHEIRHFHDALLCPFGHAAIRLRIHAIHNGFTVAMILRRLGGSANALAVPLQQWLPMPEPQRAEFLEKMRRLTGRELRMPELPVVAVDDGVSGFQTGLSEFDDAAEALIAGCRVALSDYRLIENMWRSPHREGEEIVAPTIDTWEAAGLVCQLAAIEVISNAAMMTRFCDWLADHGPQPYQRGMKVLNWCLSSIGWPPTLRNYLAMATWAQLGRFKSELRESTPLERLASILTAAGRGKRWSADSSFIDLVRGWDEVAGSDTMGGLRQASDSLKGFLARSVSDGVLAGPHGPELLSCLSAAHQRMLAAFLADPDGYVDPTAYLAMRDSYPKPCVGISFPDGPDVGTAWVDVTPAGWAPEIGFDLSLDLALMAELADALFLPGEKSLQASGRFEIRERLNLEALRIIR